jgi:hypothetical protein
VFLSDKVIAVMSEALCVVERDFVVERGFVCVVEKREFSAKTHGTNLELGLKRVESHKRISQYLF